MKIFSFIRYPIFSLNKNMKKKQEIKANNHKETLYFSADSENN